MAFPTWQQAPPSLPPAGHTPSPWRPFEGSPSPTSVEHFDLKRAIKEADLALYAHKSQVRIRAGVATPTWEGTAKVRQQVRTELERQVRPMHTPT